MKHNWKTTAAGALTILGALIAAALQYLHGQPVNIGMVTGAITTGLGLVVAADGATPQ